MSKYGVFRKIALGFTGATLVLILSCGASSSGSGDAKPEPPKDKIVNGIKVKVIDGNEVRIFDETVDGVYQEFKADKKAAEAKYAGKQMTFTGMIDHFNKDENGRTYVGLRFNDDRYDFRKLEFVLKPSEDAKVPQQSIGSVVTLTGTFKELLPTMFLLMEDSTFK